MERSAMRDGSSDPVWRLSRISLRSIRATAGILFLTCTVHAAERPASFVDAAARVPGLAVEIRYAGEHNFVGTRIDGYERPVCLLTAQAAGALAQVQHDLAGRGLGLKVFDCYRPARAGAAFLRVARELGGGGGQPR